MLRSDEDPAAFGLTSAFEYPDNFLPIFELLEQAAHPVEVGGVVGVIGPTRLNYARVVPMVDFTAQALTRLMER